MATLPKAFLLDDPVFRAHAPSGYHPERPERLWAAEAALKTLEGTVAWQTVSPRPISLEEAARAHDPAFLEALLGHDGEAGFLDPDTYLAARSVDVARRAAGGVTDLVGRILDEPDPAARRGLALVRPPGHHARRAQAMGFCLLNNVAIAARAARARGIRRVAIMDFDVHHGNGTQEIFYDDPSVLYVSTHQFPFYPGTGSLSEKGVGEGTGFTVNVPLGAGGGDSVYRAAFDRVVLPVLDEYAPELVIVSAGFDGAVEDPLAEMELSENAFGWMSRELFKVAERHAAGRFAMVLEGGYDLPALERDLGAAVRGTFGETFAIARAPDDADVGYAAKTHAGWKQVG